MGEVSGGTVVTSIESRNLEEWKEVMTIATDSHSTNHSRGITTTICATEKCSTDNTREFYTLSAVFIFDLLLISVTIYQLY